MVINMMKGHIENYRELQQKHNEKLDKLLEKKDRRDSKKRKIHLKKEQFLTEKSQKNSLFEDITPRNK